jgi:hypothetical protein
VRERRLLASWLIAVCLVILALTIRAAFVEPGPVRDDTEGVW